MITYEIPFWNSVTAIAAIAHVEAAIAHVEFDALAVPAGVCVCVCLFECYRAP